MENSKLEFKNKNGFLIAFEGISGCGKSESIRELYSYLKQKGCKVHIAEWNSNRLLRKLFSLLGSLGLLTPKVYSVLLWLGFLIDYFFKIAPLTNKGYIVLADRYVYTGLTRDAVNKAGRRLGKAVWKFVRKPDVLFFFDIPPAICYDRILKRGKTLFHTNKAIKNSRKLKNNDLFYLKKMRWFYIKLFKTQLKDQNTKIFFIRDNGISVREYVRDLIDAKTDNENRSIFKMFINKY
ncbi:MAG TPA: thymidylate kinase [Clostridia bacterium]|nr:thymidylate kinase [Clostridia bacterium]